MTTLALIAAGGWNPCVVVLVFVAAIFVAFLFGVWAGILANDVRWLRWKDERGDQVANNYRTIERNATRSAYELMIAWAEEQIEELDGAGQPEEHQQERQAE
jgi:hypothetical protein